MNHLSLIVKREYLNKVKNKSFIIMTFLTPLIIVGIFTLVAYLTSLNNSDLREINILDESNLFSTSFKSNEAIKYNFIKKKSLEEAKKTSEESKIYGLLYIPKTNTLEEIAESTIFYSEDTPSLGVIDDIEDIIRDEANKLRLLQENIDVQKIADLRIRVTTKQETYKGEKTSKLGAGLKLGFGGLAGYMLFMFIIVYGNMIMRSVIEEKTSRIIEVIVSSVKPILNSY